MAHNFDWPPAIEAAISSARINRVICADAGLPGVIARCQDFSEKEWPRRWNNWIIVVPADGFQTTGARFDVHGFADTLNTLVEKPAKTKKGSSPGYPVFRYSLADQTPFDVDVDGSRCLAYMSELEIENYFKSPKEKREFLLNSSFIVAQTSTANEKAQLPLYIREESGTSIYGNVYPAGSTSASMRKIEIGSKGLLLETFITFRGTAAFYFVKKGKIVLLLTPTSETNEQVFGAHWTGRKGRVQPLVSRLAPCKQYYQIVLNEGESAFISPAWILSIYYAQDSIMFESSYYPLHGSMSAFRGLRFTDTIASVHREVEPTIALLQDYGYKMARFLAVLLGSRVAYENFQRHWLNSVREFFGNLSQIFKNQRESATLDPKPLVVKWMRGNKVESVSKARKYNFEAMINFFFHKLQEAYEIFSQPKFDNYKYWISSLQTHLKPELLEKVENWIDSNISADNFYKICENNIWPYHFDRGLPGNPNIDIDDYPNGDSQVFEPPPNSLLNSYVDMELQLIANSNNNTERLIPTLIEKIPKDKPIAILAGIWTQENDFGGNRFGRPCFQHNNVILDTSRASNWAVLLRASNEPNCEIRFFRVPTKVVQATGPPVEHLRLQAILFSTQRIGPSKELTIPESALNQLFDRSGEAGPSDLMCTSSSWNSGDFDNDEPDPGTAGPSRRFQTQLRPQGFLLTPNQRAYFAQTAGFPQRPPSGLGRAIPATSLMPEYSNASGSRGGRPMLVPVPGYSQQGPTRYTGASRGRARTHCTSVPTTYRSEFNPEPEQTHSTSASEENIQDIDRTTYGVCGLKFSVERSITHSERHDRSTAHSSIRDPSGSCSGNPPMIQQENPEEATFASPIHAGRGFSRSTSSNSDSSGATLPIPEPRTPEAPDEEGRVRLRYPSQVPVGCLGPWIDELDLDYDYLRPNLRDVTPLPGHIWAPDGAEIPFQGIRIITQEEADVTGSIAGEYPIISLEDFRNHCEIPVFRKLKPKGNEVKCGLESCRLTSAHQTAVKRSDPKRAGQTTPNYSQLGWNHHRYHHQFYSNTKKYLCPWCLKIVRGKMVEHKRKCDRRPEDETIEEVEEEENPNLTFDIDWAWVREHYPKREDDSDDPGQSGAQAVRSTRSRRGTNLRV